MVSASSEVHGRIVSSTSLRIDGIVYGDIEASQDANISVALGSAARVEGDIHAERIFIAGQVYGNLYAKEQIELHSDARVEGDVTFGQLKIDKGAQLSGLMISRLGEMPVGAYDSSMLVLKQGGQ